MSEDRPNELRDPIVESSGTKPVPAANVVPVIDTSNSMKTNRYVEMTKNCSKAFVGYARPGDGLGVVSYDKTGRVTQAFALVGKDRAQVYGAEEAIQALSFNGSATAIGSGLQTAEGMLNSRQNPRGIVLLSDGYNNAGPKPLEVLPAGYPVYTCAMGQKADIKLMSEIALATGGHYYNSPLPSTMMWIFNQIRGLQAGGAVKIVMNMLWRIAKENYGLYAAPISGANTDAQFGVVWDDPALSYTTSPNPYGKPLISITLVNPDFTLSDAKPVVVGAGYVIFDVPSPRIGSWYVQVIPGKSKSKAVMVTTGAFEFPANPQGAADLVVSAPKSVTAGTPLSLQAHVVENGKPIDGVTVRAEVFHPTISVAGAIAANREALQNIVLTDEDREDGAPEEQVRFAKLYAELLPSNDILGHRTSPVMLTAKEGKHTATIDTPSPGSYNVQVIATGTSPETNTLFQRSHLFTVHVEG